MAHRMKKETLDIPEWALYYLANNESDGLTEEEFNMLTAFIELNFPMGYTMEVQWDCYNEFDTHPAFGLPTKTYQVDFYSH